MAHTRCMLHKQSYMHSRACTRPRARAQAGTHKHVILIAFPRQRWFANAPQYYVICTLPVVFKVFLGHPYVFTRFLKFLYTNHRPISVADFGWRLTYVKHSDILVSTKPVFTYNFDFGGKMKIGILWNEALKVTSSVKFLWSGISLKV